jgi:sterol desaturase/sphingolipid hydroxylase (fatty acid hydroxylase superfamily)
MFTRPVPTGIDNESKEPVRLFDSDILEFFTHISPVTVLVIWVPVVAFFIWRAFALRPDGAGWLFIPMGVLIGLFLWTISEYLLHRFVFHFHPKNPSERMKKFLFLVHGVHHHQPRSKTRLVMPPVMSIPLAALFYGLFYAVVALLIGAPHWVAPLFAGFICGYIAYDMLHYAIHHFSWKSKYYRVIRKHHMAHHFKTPERRFGVSSVLWDQVFKTDPVD